MTQKPKLEPGDRVAVYISGMRGTGEVTSAVGNLWVSLDEPMFTVNQGQGECVTGKSVFVSPEQCRKLRPKQKPEKERADSAAVGSIAGFAFSMDPSIPPNEVHMRHNGKTVAVFACGELPGKDKA